MCSRMDPPWQDIQSRGESGSGGGGGRCGHMHCHGCAYQPRRLYVSSRCSAFIILATNCKCITYFKQSYERLHIYLNCCIPVWGTIGLTIEIDLDLYNYLQSSTYETKTKHFNYGSESRTLMFFTNFTNECCN